MTEEQRAKRNAYRREWYKNNRDKQRSYEKKYYAIHPEMVQNRIQKAKEYRESIRNKAREYDKLTQCAEANDAESGKDK